MLGIIYLVDSINIIHIDSLQRLPYFKVIIFLVPFGFLSFLFFAGGCSSSYSILTKNEEERVSVFADRLSSDAGDIDSLQRDILKDGLKAIGEFLLEKDRLSFQKLDNELHHIKNGALFMSKIYDMKFLKMATEFYYWANERAAHKLGTHQDTTILFVSYSTPHFLIYHSPRLPENDLLYIAAEAERIYDTLLTLFNPDTLCLSNFARLAMYESWMDGKFNKQSGSLHPTNSRIVLLITETQQQLFSILGRFEHGLGGITNFSFVPSRPDSIPVWITCRIALNYSSPLSLVPLTHEIAHAFTMIAYSRPWLVDSALIESNVKSISSLSLEQLRPAIIKIDGVIAEGVGYWANWNIGTFANVHLLPNVREIIQESKIEPPSLTYLIKGEISFSFWDIVRSIFGYVPRDKITSFFISSASFMEFLLYHSTPQQLQMLFTGSSENLSVADIELIYERPISEIEE
jgi:hypothetical protein